MNKSYCSELIAAEVVVWLPGMVTARIVLWFPELVAAEFVGQSSVVISHLTIVYCFVMFSLSYIMDIMFYYVINGSYIEFTS